MYRPILLAAIIMLSTNVFTQQKINIIPQPVSLAAEKGNFMLDEKTSVSFSSANKDLQTETKFLINAVNDISGINLSENKS